MVEVVKMFIFQAVWWVFHPSIDFLFYCIQGDGVVGACPSYLKAKVGYTLDKSLMGPLYCRSRFLLSRNIAETFCNKTSTECIHLFTLFCSTKEVQSRPSCMPCPSYRYSALLWCSSDSSRIAVHRTACLWERSCDTAGKGPYWLFLDAGTHTPPVNIGHKSVKFEYGLESWACMHVEVNTVYMVMLR